MTKDAGAKEGIRAGGWSACKELSTAEIGAVAEGLAADFLVKHRVQIVARNVKVGRGEIDIVARSGDTPLVVEVRAVRQRRESMDPLTAFDEAKSRQVASLAGRIGVGRVDLVTVSFSAGGVDLHWLPWAAWT